MRSTFEVTLPDDATIQGRYDLTRLKAAPAEIPRSRLGLGVGAGVLVAAAGALLAWSLATEGPVAIEASLQRDLQARRGDEARASRGRGDTELVPPVSTPRMGPESRDTVGESATTARTPVADTGRMGAQGETAAPGETAALEGTTTPAESGWAQVTEAMRRRDWPAAEAALAPLLVSSEPETRDSARLVRIRLALGSAQAGVRDGLLLELEELAKSGSTSSIRASARRLHKSLLDDETKQPTTDATKLPAPEGELPLKEEE